MHHIKEKHGWDNLNDTLCRFGNLSITQANVISHTEMECESPPSYEDREVPVEITLNTREWTSDGVIFTYYHPPFVYGIAPRIGPVSGNTTVVVTGSNFENTGYVRCKFGDIFTKGEYISENELRCISPKVEKPGFVKLSIAIREDEFSSGLSTKYLYYDTPLITGQSPYCGPESGFTQITVKGDNFADTGSDNVKCIFDGNIRMNATVMNEHEIKCDSPSVLNYKGINEKNIKYYDVMITLNGVDFNGPAHKFYYYKDTIISKLDPFYGPISGNTTVDMTGFNFNQTGACNPVVRFSTYEVKPKIFNNTNLQVVSPKVNWTGATTVQLALNGQQFDKDITIRYRDFENTFWYYKNPLVTFMSPNKGPTIGGTNIKVLGIGFDEIFAYQKDPKKKKLYYKFIDKKDNKTQYGNTFLTKVKNNHALELITPGVYKNGTVTEVYISYNNQNFDKIENNTFTFYVLPNITKLEPKYGPLKATNYKKIKLTLDNYICTENCDILICRYKSKNTIFYEKGIYLDANWVNCTIPRVNSPESFNVELSFNNGDDWTNNGFTYTFYDPYIISVHPQMVSTRGGTTVKIHGLGFANSGPNLKVRFGGEKPSEKLECNYGECNKKAKYIQDTDLEVKTFPQEIVNYLSSGKSVKFNKFAVEVSVYNDDFTNNNMTIFYYKEPELGSDEDIGAGLDPKTKKMIRDSLIRSLPANLDTMIGIPINTRAIMDSFSTIEMYANYTCKYTMKKTNVTKTTKGIISSIPLEKDLKNMFLCQSPEWSEVGEGNISISLNGYDFSESTYKIEFTDPISMVKMYPMCGPLQGKTEVTILGTGFVRSKKMIFKWGVQNLVAMSSSSLLETLDSSKTDPSIIRTSKFEIKKVDVRAPRAPFYLKTQGGLDYISISKLSFFPLSDFVSQFFTNQYIHTNYEYYYYKQPYIQSFSPHGSIVTGGTSVLVVGAWFQNKPEYGVKPFCKFGNNIVEGEFLSTVRITCTSPPSEKINVRVPFDVSLNGVDFTHSDLKFTYYNDFSKAAFIDMDPKSGPSTGGTVIKLYGSNFTSLLDPDEFLCQFKPNDARMQPKNVPAGFKQYDDGRQAIICNTPGGWMSGSIANILITFDGQKFVDSSFKFYFYKMTDYIPKSGPNTGNGPIHVKGSGFKNSTKVKCILDRRQNIKPISIDTRDIL
ncbi:MAG: hypothetical protein GY861_25580 [bacterium]|nr:hypothetical protein [bacterium]